MTLPSQVKTCSSASSSGSSDASTPVDGACGTQAEASEASAVAASGGSGRHVQREPVRVEHRAHHRDALDRLAPDPVGHDRDHAAALLEPGPHRLDEHADLLLPRRLEERVDPALGVEQPLRAQPEDEHDRRRPSGVIFARRGHHATLVTRTRHVDGSPHWSSAPIAATMDAMTVAFVGLTLLALALIVVPRVQRARRAAAAPRPRSRWRAPRRAVVASWGRSSGSAAAGAAGRPRRRVGRRPRLGRARAARARRREPPRGPPATTPPRAGAPTAAPRPPAIAPRAAAAAAAPPRSARDDASPAAGTTPAPRRHARGHDRRGPAGQPRSTRPSPPAAGAAPAGRPVAARRGAESPPRRPGRAARVRGRRLAFAPPPVRARDRLRRRAYSSRAGQAPPARAARQPRLPARALLERRASR